MIRAIIFDCFGVLYGGSLEALVSMAPVGMAQQVRDINSAKDYGYITSRDYLMQIGEVIGVTSDKVADIMRRGHTPNGPLIAVTQKLKSQYKIGLLSNIGDSLFETLFDGKAEQLFDAVVLSYREGIAKPNPEVFRLMAERLNLSPGECVMIDDLADNCEGAEVAGMRTIVHTDNASTMEQLKQLGITV